MQPDVQLSFLDFVLNHYILVAVFLVSLYVVVVNTIKMKVSKVRMLSPQDVVYRINHDNALVLDVRAADEYAAGHLPEAVNVIESDVQNDNLGNIAKDRSRPVVIIDKDGTRTYELGAYLLKAGFVSVSALHGGMFSWQQEGLPTVRK
ncbi:MAG: rhodanese-like domain-containing protein [Succinivibrionaceae bacterium]|nr:rhodanese-like domain-containing protein [Succinivibrionaceae bacterium]